MNGVVPMPRRHVTKQPTKLIVGVVWTHMVESSHDSFDHKCTA